MSVKLSSVGFLGATRLQINGYISALHELRRIAPLVSISAEMPIATRYGIRRSEYDTQSSQAGLNSPI